MPSAAIRSYSYDRTLRELAIGYVGGGDYVYLDVSPEDWEGLRSASSRGEFVNRVIKPRYRYERRDRTRPPIRIDE